MATGLTNTIELLFYTFFSTDFAETEEKINHTSRGYEMVIEQLSQLSPKIPYDELQILLEQIKLNLINPIQRLPRYQLFIKDIFKTLQDMEIHFSQMKSLADPSDNSQNVALYPSFVPNQILKHVSDLKTYFETHCDNLDVDLLKDQVMQTMQQWICLQLHQVEQLKKNYSSDTTNDKWQGLDLMQKKIKVYHENFIQLQKTDIYFMNLSNNFYKGMIGIIEQVKQQYPSLTCGFMSRVSAFIDGKFIDAINQHQSNLEKLEQQCLTQWNTFFHGRPGLIAQAHADIHRHQL